MKKYLLYIAVIALASCKNTGEAEVKIAPTHENHTENIEVSIDLNETSEQTAVTFNAPKYLAVYTAYLEVKASLVNTNGAVAQAKANRLSESLTGLEGVSPATQTAVKAMIATKNVKDQRVAFETVSQNIETILSANLSSGTIYKQYCPMAFNGKGAYWLSDSKEIRNPYYGDKMLKCGIVEAQLN